MTSLLVGQQLLSKIPGMMVFAVCWGLLCARINLALALGKQSMLSGLISPRFKKHSHIAGRKSDEKCYLLRPSGAHTHRVLLNGFSQGLPLRDEKCTGSPRESH